jgi:preprotein translocase subunit SecF
MACCGRGGKSANKNKVAVKISPMENYIIDENYDLSKFKTQDLERNVFTINAINDGFEVKDGGSIDVHLIYRRNAMQDSIVNSRSLLTVKRQIDSKFGNKSNTRKLIAVPIKKEVVKKEAPKKVAKKIKPKLEKDAGTNNGSNTSAKTSAKTGRKPRKNK